MGVNLGVTCPRVPAATLCQRGRCVELPQLVFSVRPGDKSSAEQSVAALCKVQGSGSEAEAGGHPPWGDTAMLFEELLVQGKCSPRAGAGVGKGAGAIEGTPCPTGGVAFQQLVKGCASRRVGWVRWEGG